MGSGAAAYAYYPMTGGQSVAGDVWYNVNYGVNQTQTAGSYGYMTSLHEIGHALGLNVVKVLDQVNGRDGVDSLMNVQYLKFADQTIATSTLQPNKAPILTVTSKALSLGQTIAVFCAGQRRRCGR